MNEYWPIFCAVGVVYTFILTILFIGKGLWQVIWPILIIVCVAVVGLEINLETNEFVMNEELIPAYIFHPACLAFSPILAVCFAISYRLKDYPKQ